MSSLEQIIIEKIKSEGPVNFETFMEMALYYPGLGYYARRSPKIGREGDFFTSSHLHPIFGAMIGCQIKEMWLLTGKPEIFHIVEAGSGMGYLAKDMLEYLKRSDENNPSFGKGRYDSISRGEEGFAGGSDFFKSIQYTVVEPNPSASENQKALLREYGDKVRWVSGFDELKTIKGCFLSNELLDAFPVKLVEMDGGLKEIYVSYEEDKGFFEVKKPCSKETGEYLDEFSIALPEGFRTEANLRIKDWMEAVCSKLSEGFVLTVDYGYPAGDYYSEDRNRGTLLCYYRHNINEDPYRNIGEQDLTAHVNFSSLKKWGDDKGVKTVGFASQGTYLVSLGIDEVIAEFCGDSPDPFDIAKIKRLILPQGLGESHKVMIQYKGKGEVNLRGFNLRNHVKKL